MNNINMNLMDASTFKNIVRGDPKNILKLMMEESQKLGADAIINVRYQTAMVMSGASEVLAYGTAVKNECSPKLKHWGILPG